MEFLWAKQILNYWEQNLNNIFQFYPIILSYYLPF